MRQLTIDDYNQEKLEEESVYDIFKQDLKIIQDYKDEPVPAAQKNKVYKVGYYVRCHDGNVYPISGLAPDSKIITGYRTLKTRQGHPYKQAQYTYRKVIKRTYYEDGKQREQYIYEDEISEVHECLIDSVFKDDWVYDTNKHLYKVLHKETGKTKDIITFDKYGKRMQAKTSTSTLVCSKGNNIYHFKHGDIISKLNTSIDYLKYIKVGDHVFTYAHGWSVVVQILSHKVLCKNQNFKNLICIWESQIKKIQERD